MYVVKCMSVYENTYECFTFIGFIFDKIIIINSLSVCSNNGCTSYRYIIISSEQNISNMTNIYSYIFSLFI